MSFNRRALVATGLALGSLLPGAAAAAGPRQKETSVPRRDSGTGLIADSALDQSRTLQLAIDAAAGRGGVVTLPAGRVLVRDIRLRPGIVLQGHPGRSVLALAGPGTLITGHGVHGLRLEGFQLDGNGQALSGGDRIGLVTLTASRDIVLRDLTVARSAAHGVMLTGCSGQITDCRIADIAEAGLFSLDAAGLEIAHNVVTDCANNGLLVWRTAAGEDGTVVTANRIERIRAAKGGSGQCGNGVNVYRAANVLVTGNRIADCAYTAIRGNSASNIQMIANACSRIGEVALYAEFAFEGAVIASNVVETAAAGISVTNFNEGGRLAVVQGNLIRNLTRREYEPVDKRGEAIAVEADSVVTGNTIENAPTAGIVIGWGAYRREVVATSNVIRNARVGIMVANDPAGGAVMIAQNMISGTKEGAVRAMDKGVLVGPDLARQAVAGGRIAVSGNMVADAAS